MASTPLTESKKPISIIHHTTTSHRKLQKHVSKIRKPHGESHDRQFFINIGKEVQKMMIKQEVEHKRIENKDGPTELGHLPAFEYIATPKSMPMVSAYRSLFRDKIYSFRMSTTLTMSSSASGAINSTIAINAVQSISDFVSMAVIFEEFFVTDLRVQWRPVSRYNGPLGFAQATQVANLPISLASLQHLEVAYTSEALLVNHYSRSKGTMTGDPFSYDWKNVEKPSSTVEVVATTTAPTQGWCSTTSGQTLTGMIQIISLPAPPGLPVSSVLGSFVADYDVLFRVRA